LDVRFCHFQVMRLIGLSRKTIYRLEIADGSGDADS